MENALRKDYLKLHVSVLLAGFTGIFGKLITLNEVLLVWYRLFFSLVIFYLLLLIYRKVPKDSLKDITKISCIGALLGLHFLLFFASIKYANVSVGVVCYSLVGFFTVIFEPLLCKKKLSLIELFYSLIAVVGISLIFNIDTHYRFGIILGVLSSAVFAIYTILNKTVGESRNVKSLLLYELFGGTLFVSMVIPFFLWFGNVEFILPSITNIFYLFILVFFCTIGLYILHIQVLKTIPVFTVSLCGNLEPVYGILLAVIFLGEARELSLTFFIGMFLILLSVFLQTGSSKKVSNA